MAKLEKYMNKKIIKYAKKLFPKSLKKYLKVKRKLPNDIENTYIWVTPEARMKFLKPGKSVFEEDYGGLLYIARNMVEMGDTVWDIGGNIGVFTFAAAREAGRFGEVVSVEPDILLVRLMRMSKQIKSNRDLNVKILPAAVSSEDKISEFMISGEGRNTNSLKSEIAQKESKYVSEVTVPTYSLDTLLEYYKPPDILKVDVEGAEYKVMRGAKKILSYKKPKIYCEVSDKNVKKVTKILHENDYNLYKIEKRKLIKIDRCNFNTIAVPK